MGPAPEDDPDFQGLLDEDEGTAAYPDISAELPGVELEAKEREYQTIMDEPEPDFWDLAGATLHNAGIDTNAIIWDAQGDAVLQAPGPALTADEDEVVYELTFDLPDAGLGVVAGADDTSDMGSDRCEDVSTVVMGADDDTAGRRYPTRTCRSIVGNQPYNTYVPRMTFLQLGAIASSEECA